MMISGLLLRLAALEVVGKSGDRSDGILPVLFEASRESRRHDIYTDEQAAFPRAS